MTLPRSAARRLSRMRSSSLVEGLERRALFSLTVTTGGVTAKMIDLEPEIGVDKTTTPKRGRGGGDGAPGYQITIAFTGGLTASQQAIFTQAAAKWESILTADIPDISSAQYGLIDDIRIEASGEAIDGVGKILGSAGPTNIRSGSNLTYAGRMRFDTADLANLEAAGTLDEVITHEMGHVIGIGSLWSFFSLVQGRVANGGTDPQYIGAAAVAEYRSIAGNAAVWSIPVENTGGSGTQDAHWREAGVGSLGNELMTGYLNSTMVNPVSRISAASLIDMGYPGVNLDAADLYTVPVNPPGNFAPTNPLPTVGALNASSPSVATGSSFTLSLASATDNTAVNSIAFYRESNGIPGLQAATGGVAYDTLVTTNAGGNLTATVPAGLGAGTYLFYARAADTFGALSAVATTTVTIAATPAAPSQPLLSAAQDTGSSGSDGITKLNVLTFTGTATPNATVTLQRDGSTVIGTGTADNSGSYSITTGSLADGTFTVTAIASNAGGTSAASAGQTITVDTVAPAVVSVSYDRELTQAITVTLDDALAEQLSTTTVTLENLTQTSVVANTTIVVSGAGRISTFGRGSLLPDGNYRLTVPADAVTDAAGNALAGPTVFTFGQLGGDANGDGMVNFDDLVTLSQSYGSADRSVSSGNFDYSSDGRVDFSDLVILAQNYGKSLIPVAFLSIAPSPAPSPPAAKAPKRGSNAKTVLE